MNKKIFLKKFDKFTGISYYTNNLIEKGGDSLEQKKRGTPKKEIVKETRDLKMMFSKSAKGTNTPRLAFPMLWIKDMGINLDDRDTEVTYSPRTKKITIRKKSSKVSNEEVGE